MMNRLRFNTGGNNNNNNGNNGAANSGSSIFSGIVTGTGLSLIGGGGGANAASKNAQQDQQQNMSVLPGTAAERAAAHAAAASMGDSDDLPPGWRLVSSRHSGRDYYLHIATGHAQWEKPTEAEPRPSAAIQQPQKQNNMTNVLSGVSRVGAGLSSMFSQANNRLQTTLQNTNVSAAMGKSAPPRSQSAGREGQALVEVYENERLAGRLQPNDPKKYSDRDCAPGSGSDTFPEGDLPEGHEWVTEWEVDQNYTSVDRDGWTYAVDFVDVVRLLNEDLSHASRHPTDAVRRRRWVRYHQVMTHSPRSPRESGEDAKSMGSSWNNESALDKASTATPESSSFSELDDDDDPFHRAAQKQQTGFRVNMKFPHRGGKDNTKDYQSMNLTDVMWLVNAHDVAKAPTDELMREKTANLEERIKEATTRSMALEKELRAQHSSKSKDIAMQQKKLDALIAQYRKVQAENEALQETVAAHRATVDALRKEATEKDIMANEEQRAMNAEMSAANQALEEKAKALATARMRYKRDNKSLSAAVEDAKQRLEQQQKAKANVESHDPVAKELKAEMEKVRQVHAKLEAVRQHRLALEEESKTLFNLVVEKKADMKFKSKKKLELALNDVDEKLKKLKEEQAALTKSLAQKPEGEELRKLNARRNDIRGELGALKERRTMLLAEKRKQEGSE